MFTVYIVNNFIYFVKGFDVKNKHFYLPFVRVHICTVSDALPALQRPPPSRSPRVACLVSGADRCSVSSVWACVSVRRVLHGLPCCLRCAVCSGALWLWSPPAGYIGRAGGWAVDTSRRKNSKKAFSPPAHPLCSAQNTPTPIVNLKNFPQKQKDPYKGSVFCAILALQALKGRNLQWLKVK